MRRRRIAFVKKPCDRCGREVTTGTRSILGMDDLKRRLGVLCSRCVTPEEEALFIGVMGRRLARGDVDG